MGDVDVADADDEVRTSTSQYHVRATLCTKEFFFRTQYKYVTLPSYQQIGVGGGGQEIDSQHNTQKVSASFQLPAEPPYCRTGFIKPIQLFCNWGRGGKPIF